MPGIIKFLGYDPQPPAQSFREAILRTRRGLGMNQPQIAKALGVPTPTLRAWERGLHEPAPRRKSLVEEKIGRLRR